MIHRRAVSIAHADFGGNLYGTLIEVNQQIATSVDFKIKRDF